MKKSTVICIGFLAAIAFGCKKDANKEETYKGSNPYLNPALTYGVVKDIDGNIYPTIKIGGQIWMAENLRTTKYNTGVPIVNEADATAWGKLTTGAWCNYNNKTENDAIYGKLYNWYAVNTGKLCPQGWHIPSDEENQKLSDQILATTINIS